MSAEKPRVLFLCTANAARSQMAEALLRKHAGERYHACSAGLEPTEVHPFTARVLEEIGVDTSALRAKSLQAFLGKVPVRYAVVVCEKAQQLCPRFYPFALNNLYWPFDDPAAFAGSEAAKLEKFRDVRDQIDTKIQAWLHDEAR
jgi:arsenate reductase